MLGDILAAARASSAGFARWLEGTDPSAAGRVAAAAAVLGETPTGFVRAAVADFSEAASAEDWADLTARLRDSADPGAACLLAMTRWRLAEFERRHSPGEGARDERPG